jgi:hypothetical protein
VLFLVFLFTSVDLKYYIHDLYLNKNKINNLNNLLNEFLDQGIINNHQKQVLHRIRSAYNLIKHDRRGRTSFQQVEYFYQEFCKITGI